MATLEQTLYYIEVLYICAYVGFILWGVAGWYLGRFFLRRNEPIINRLNRKWVKENKKDSPLINVELMRKIEGDNFEKNGEINELKGQIAHYEEENKIISEANKALELQNKSLWYWNYAPHREAEFITIKQQDKNGEEVASSQIMLPDSKDWAYQPVAFADEQAEDFYQWKEERHQAEASHL
jgi:hypothetical protein